MNGDPLGLLDVVLDRRFRIASFVGEGDLSVIYKGHDLHLDCAVAIKCLHLPDTLDPALTRPVVEAFEGEAFEGAGRLLDGLGRGNPHVAPTIAAGRTKAPRTGATVPYRVREWFEGESLASELARRKRQGDKPRTVEEAFALLAPAIEGIAHAHEAGIAHLSLDPGNLFLARKDGSFSLKVLDFGTVRAGHRADARPTLDPDVTRGLHLLHPAYAAPEQLDMELGHPGAWSDVYALALIMMEVLADRFELARGDTAALVRRALDKQKRPTPRAYGLKLPKAVDLVLTRAVSRRPEDRQKNARVFLNELKAALGQDAPVKAPSPLAGPPRFAPLPQPSKPMKAPASPKPAAGPRAAPAIEGAAAVESVPVVFVAPTPRARPIPQAEPAFPAPTAAVSGPVVAAARAEDLPRAAVAPPPSVFRVSPLPSPAPLSVEEEIVLRPPFPRTLLLRVGVAALALAGVVAVLFAVAKARRPSERLGATLEAARAPGATTVARPAAAPVPPPAAQPVAALAAAPLAPAVADPPAAADAVSAPETSHSRPSTRAPLVRFSGTAAQHAVQAVKRRMERCRRGPFWGNGYATVAFWNDGAVHQVLVDPPFSMTLAGKCIADALRTVHMPSFTGRTGYYRFRFSIAQR